MKKEAHGGTLLALYNWPPHDPALTLEVTVSETNSL